MTSSCRIADVDLGAIFQVARMHSHGPPAVDVVTQVTQEGQVSTEVTVTVPALVPAASDPADSNPH
jgi:hypothetical protein